uniref:Uncharacterized protein n=1 Tax=Megaselia scalaris TaxID=36166 RepID=T1H3B3_MEGSC
VAKFVTNGSANSNSIENDEVLICFCSSSQPCSCSMIHGMPPNNDDDELLLSRLITEGGKDTSRKYGVSGYPI